MKQSFMQTQKNHLVKKFHILLGKAGVDNEGKLSMLASYGVQSSKDLNVYELTELCGKLDLMVNPVLKEADVWRKRVIAAIGKYLETIGRDRNDLAVIMAIACRAAKAEDFNHIPLDRLRSIYNAFNQRVKDAKLPSELTLPEAIQFQAGTETYTMPFPFVNGEA